MNLLLWLIWVVVIVAIAIWAFGGAQRRRRQSLEKAAEQGGLTSEDWASIQRHCPMVSEMLPESYRAELEKVVLVLLEEKNFEACGDLDEVTREMKVVILAQAALLLVGRPHKYYEKLRTVLIYPDAYHGGDEDEDPEDSVRLGESWESGSVVLSWRSVRKGGENTEDGHNVVIHEFAHQLDQENRHADGFPVLQEGEAIADWSHAFSEAYERFQEDIDAGRRTVMDSYGATNPAEFFAVGTETFFEKAEQLQEDEPKLYEQFKDYYGLDPATWRRSPARYS